VLDQDSYRLYVAGQMNYQVLAQSGHLICIRLTSLPAHAAHPAAQR
jgi:hypothetical protein